MISDPESNLNSTFKPESGGSAGVYPSLSRDVSEMEIDEKTVLEQRYNQPQPQTGFGTPISSSGHPLAYPTSRDYHGRQGPKALLDQVHHNLEHRSGTPPSVDGHEAEETIVPNEQLNRTSPRTDFGGHGHEHHDPQGYVVVDEMSPHAGHEGSNMLGTTSSKTFQYTRQSSSGPQLQRQFPDQRRTPSNQPHKREDYDYQQAVDINGLRQQSGLAAEHPRFDNPPTYEIIMSPRTNNDPCTHEPLRYSPLPGDRRPFQETNISRPSPTQQADQPITPTKVSSVTDSRINEPMQNSSLPRSSPPFQETIESQSPLNQHNGPPVPAPRRSRGSENTSVTSVSSEPQNNHYKIKYEQAMRHMKKMQNELHRTREEAQRQIQWERQSSARLNCE